MIKSGSDMDELIKEKYGNEVTCRFCGITQPVSEFYISRKHILLNKICKKCVSQHRKIHTLNPFNKNTNRQKRDPITCLYDRAKYRAKQLSKEFNINKYDIEIPEVCPVFGTKLEVNVRDRKRSASLDRIDNSKGYVKGNVQVISWLANTMKNSATSEQLKIFAEWVEREYCTEDQSWC